MDTKSAACSPSEEMAKMWTRTVDDCCMRLTASKPKELDIVIGTHIGTSIRLNVGYAVLSYWEEWPCWNGGEMLTSIGLQMMEALKRQAKNREMFK